MADVDKIILERAEDGEHWKMQTEGDEVEGHALRGRGRFAAEPAGQQQDGQELYKVDFGGEDAEGHAYRWSDGRLKRALQAL